MTTYNPKPETLEDVRRRFTYHPPHGDQQPRYELLRARFRDLAELILQTVPPGREQALALTQLEQGCMWANAGIARGETQT